MMPFFLSSEEELAYHGAIYHYYYPNDSVNMYLLLIICGSMNCCIKYSSWSIVGREGRWSRKEEGETLPKWNYEVVAVHQCGCACLKRKATDWETQKNQCIFCGTLQKRPLTPMASTFLPFSSLDLRKMSHININKSCNPLIRWANKRSWSIFQWNAACDAALSKILVRPFVGCSKVNIFARLLLYWIKIMNTSKFMKRGSNIGICFNSTFYQPFLFCVFSDLGRRKFSL